MRRLVPYLLAPLLASACNATLPTAPGRVDTVERGSSPESETSTISGWIYATADWADPPLAGAVVEVAAADGLNMTTVSDTSGFYELSVPRGTGLVSISSSKNGYRPERHDVALSKVTVLNFFLTPM